MSLGTNSEGPPPGAHAGQDIGQEEAMSWHLSAGAPGTGLDQMGRRGRAGGSRRLCSVHRHQGQGQDHLKG